MAGHVLILGVIGPGPHAGRPRALDLVGTEHTGAGIEIRTEEAVGLLDRRQLVRADGGVQGGGEADEDSLAVGDRAVPVVHHQKLVALPAHVVGQPIAMADHGLPLPRSQPVTGTTAGPVDPLGAVDLVEVDLGALGPRPQPGLTVIPRRPRRRRIQR